jgi:hypothetical protein
VALQQAKLIPVLHSQHLGNIINWCKHPSNINECHSSTYSCLLNHFPVQIQLSPFPPSFYCLFHPFPSTRTVVDAVLHLVKFLLLPWQRRGDTNTALSTLIILCSDSWKLTLQRVVRKFICADLEGIDGRRGDNACYSEDCVVQTATAVLGMRTDRLLASLV